MFGLINAILVNIRDFFKNMKNQMVETYQLLLHQ